MGLPKLGHLIVPLCNTYCRHSKASLKFVQNRIEESKRRGVESNSQIDLLPNRLKKDFNKFYLTILFYFSFSINTTYFNI